MNIRTLWFVAAALFLFAAISTHAQGRFELTPFVGYETSASYSIIGEAGPIGQDALSSLRVNGTAAYGAFVDYNFSENFQPEFMWNHNNTSYSGYDTVLNTYVSQYHSDIDQFQFGGLYMFRNSDVKLRPYFAASLGFTHETNGDQTPDHTLFSYSVGGGVKYYLTRHIGFRADARYLPTHGSYSSSSTSTPPTPLFCSPVGCYVGSVSNFLNRGSFTAGIVIKF